MRTPGSGLFGTTTMSNQKFDYAVFSEEYDADAYIHAGGAASMKWTGRKRAKEGQLVRSSGERSELTQFRHSMPADRRLVVPFEAARPDRALS